MSEREDELVAWAARTASEPVVSSIRRAATRPRRVAQMLLGRLCILRVAGPLYSGREALPPCFRGLATLPTASRLLASSPPPPTPDLRLPTSGF